MRIQKILLLAVVSISGCTRVDQTQSIQNETSSYLDYSNFDDRFEGGVKRIPIQTEIGEFHVWTKRIGNNPKIKVLLLHGGPGATHEYFECFDAYFPKAGIEYYYYDQLESAYSDQPNDSKLWNTERYVDEVEQVRKALGLNKDNFYLLGHSWGGILAAEYALKYQDNLKGLILSNIMSSMPEYTKYVKEKLAPQLPETVLKKIMTMEENQDFDNPKYLELLHAHYYTKHILRRSLDTWPDPVNRAFSKLNQPLYVAMQGPSEFGIAGDASLKNWDIRNKLSSLKVPILTIGGNYDSMDPKHMEWMASQVQNGQYLNCPKGSHFSMYDDQQTYFDGLIRFVKGVNTKK